LILGIRIQSVSFVVLCSEKKPFVVPNHRLFVNNLLVTPVTYKADPRLAYYQRYTLFAF